MTIAGRVQVNIGEIDGKIAFRNWIKGAAISSSFAVIDPSKMDSSGYPIASLAAAIPMSMTIPTSYQGVSEQWVLKNTGTRTLKVDTDTRAVTVVSSSGGTVTGGTNSAMTVSGANWRVVFTWDTERNPRVLNLPTGDFYTAGTGELVLCRLSDEAALDAGDPFLPEFVSFYEALSPVTVRTMPLAHAGAGNVCTNAMWANRPTTSHLSYANAYFKPDIYAGTASGTDQYTVAAATNTNLSGYDTNEMIQMRITNASNSAITISGTANNGGKVQLTVNSTAALSPGQSVWIGILNGTVEARGQQTVLTVDDATHVTLDVNFVNAYATSTPAAVVGTATLTVTGKTDDTKHILNMNGAPLNWNASGISANSNRTFIYDDVLGAWLYFGSSGGIVAGWPVETQVALANKLNCNLWIIIPPLASAADATSLATLVSGSIANSCYFEYGNEIWNPAFPHTVWATQRARVFGFTQDFHSYYAVAVRVMMEAATTGWGARTTGLKRVLAQQNVNPAQSARMNGSECVAGNAAYNAFTGSRSFNATPNRPIDYTDVLATGPYIDGANLRNPVIGWTTREAAGLQAIADAWNAADEAGAIQLIDEDVRQGLTNVQTVTVGGGDTFTGSVAYSNGWMVRFKTTGAIFTGVSLDTGYFVVNSSGNTFKIALTAGGSALTGISGGSGTQSVGRLGGGSEQTLLNQTLKYYPNFESLAAGYDSQRSAIGLSPLTVECYEGALEHMWTSAGGITSAICDTIGMSPTGSGDGSAYAALVSAYTAWLSSNYAQQFEYDYLKQFDDYTHFRNPGHFLVGGPTTWSLSPGDFTATPHQLFEGARLYSVRLRRKILTATA